jgi:assimilatory nitrate reductase catalytic subunit
VSAAVDTHCPYCALQCAMSLTPGTDPVVEVRGRDFPTNRGGLCQKGWTSARVLDAPARLLTPLVRRPDGELAPATWDEALEIVVAGLHRVQREHGRAAVALFGGGGLTNEKAYTLGKLARVALRTPHVDYNGRFCMSSAAAAGNRAFGVDRGLPFPLADVGGADAVLLLGSNLAETMPPAVQHLAGARSRGGLVVVDPRAGATASLTEDGGGVHLQPVPGTDLALLLGLLHIVLAEGLADADYLAERTTGLGDLRRSVAAWWPERTERVTGVPASRLRQTAGLLAEASPARGGRGAYVLTGRGVEQHTKGTDTVTAAINLALALGLPGRPGSGFGCLTGQGNGQGGREHGQKCDQLPGYRRLDDPAARAHVAAVWGVDPSDLPGPGRPAVELLRSLGADDGPRALLVHGSNLLVSAPNATRVRERLATLDLLVVCDVVLSETAAVADVVLPVTQWAEEEGTMTTLEGRVVRRRRAVRPPPGVRTELEVWRELATRLGSTTTFADDAEAVFTELAAASAGGPADYSGIDYGRLDAGEALHWPCPATAPEDDPHPGTPRLFLKRFMTVDGRARLVPVDHRPPDDDVHAEAPVHLVTGRVLQHYQSGAQTRQVPELVRAEPGGFVEIHPYLAARVGVDDGEPVRVSSRRGSLVAPARITRSARPDTVFVPFHFAGPALANAVTNDATDPVSGMPELKVCAVRLERVEP